MKVIRWLVVFLLYMLAFRIGVAHAENLPVSGGACYEWGMGDRSLLHDDKWSPDHIRVSFSETGIQNQRKMHVEFWFDNNPPLYKGWTLDSLLNAKSHYYPFVFEMKFIVSRSSGVDVTGDERGVDWRFSADGVVAGQSDQPGAYIDTQFGDNDPNRKIGFGLVRPDRIKKDVHYHFEVRLSVPSNANVTGSHIISRLGIDMATAGLLRKPSITSPSDPNGAGSPGYIFGGDHIGYGWKTVYTNPLLFPGVTKFVILLTSGDLLYGNDPQMVTFGAFALEDQTVGGVEYKFTTYPIVNINSLSGSYEYHR